MMRKRSYLTILAASACMIGVLLPVTLSAQASPTNNSQPAAAATKPASQSTGYATHSPVLAGACKFCVWGALADTVQQSMHGTGWNIRVCYTCAGGEKEVINVEDHVNGATLAYNPTSLEAEGVPPSEVSYEEPPPPNAPVDFGIATPSFLWWGYSGQETKAGMSDLPPFKDLRLIGTIVQPIFLVTAATTQSGITSLADVKTLVSEGKPVHIVWDNGISSVAAQTVLSYYGLSVASIEAAGGTVESGINPADRSPVDVVIYTGDLSEADEFNVLYQLSQQYNLNYFQLPKALLHELTGDYDMVPLTMPDGFLRGVWKPIQTVGYLGDSVYGRCDMPNQFAYDVAKALNQNQLLLETGFEHFSYDPAQVWKAYGVPLAAGAEQYYRQMGYIKGHYALQSQVSC